MEDLSLNTSSDTLRSELLRAMAQEHTSTASLLFYLAEYEARDLHLRDGYSSLFKFLTEGHGYSEAAAARRCTAARFCRRHPEALAMVSSGELSLSVIGLVVRTELSAQRVPDALAAVKHKSKAQAEFLLTEMGETIHRPRREKVRVLKINDKKSERKTLSSAPQNETRSLFDELVPNESLDANNISSNELPFGPEAAPAMAYQVSLYLSADAMTKLRRAQELLGRTDIASTITELANFYTKKKDPLANLTRETFTAPAALQEPAQRPAPRSRYIPVAVKREAYESAAGQCSYVDPQSGRRCAETRFLQYDHVWPFALGGDQSASNIRLLCSGHNKLWAKDCFGEAFVRSKIKTMREP